MQTRLWALGPLALLCALAVLELAAHAAARSAVDTLAEWREAARFVREHVRARDLITSAPEHTDPRLRQVLGDLIDHAAAGRSDLAAFERLWVLSIRGAERAEAAGARAELSRRFGRVTVTRFALGPSAVAYDLTSQVRGARVSSGPRAAARACAWRKHRAPRGGGLGLGVLAPVERFACEEGTWVAEVVQEDLSITPRHCVRQGVTRRAPVRVTLPDVPLGARLVLHGGLYYEDERMRQGAPVETRVLLGERELGRVVHLDGEGWKRTAWATGGGRADVTIEVRTRSARERSYCWAASTRQGAR